MTSKEYSDSETGDGNEDGSIVVFAHTSEIEELKRAVRNLQIELSDTKAKGGDTSNALHSLDFRTHCIRSGCIFGALTGAYLGMAAYTGFNNSAQRDDALARNITDLRTTLEGIDTKSCSPEIKTLLYFGSDANQILSEFDCTDGKCTISDVDLQSLDKKGYRLITVTPTEQAEDGAVPDVE